MSSWPKKILLAVGLLALLGCGGDKVENAAHLRFFNAYADDEDVRVYIGDHLYDAGSVGPALSYANNLRYDDVPSGSQTIVATPYIDPTTTWVSATQTLVEGANYTGIGVTVSGTRRLIMFADNSSAVSGAASFRFVNAAPSTTPLYITLIRSSDSSVIYQSSTTTGGLAVGSTTGYRTTTLDEDEEEEYLVNVYGSSDFTNRLATDVEVTLKGGEPRTIVLYDKLSGGTIGVRTGNDVSEN